MVNDFMICGVEAGGEHGFRHGHTNRHRETLSKRSAGRLNAGCHTVLGVACGAGTDLTERFDIIHRHILITGKMQKGIE